ncbi:MAG: histidine kinase [Bacteroidetes bacterium]|nr:histidine kinase [Bacteroidota bacterium]
MRRILHIILVISFFNNIIAQNNIDSLIKILPTLKEDTNKVNVLKQISVKTVFGDPAKGLIYGEKSLDLAKKINWKKGIALGYSCIGDAYENQGNNAKALELRLIEVKLWEELDDKKSLSGTLGNIGVSYSNLSDNLNALKYYTAALKVAENIGYKKVITNMLINIATVFQDQKNYKKAKEYFNKALPLAIERNAKNSISIIKTNLGVISVEEKEFALGKTYYFEALSLAKELDRKMFQAFILANIAQAYALQGDSALSKNNIEYSNKKFNEAIEYHEMAKRVAKEIELYNLIAGIEGSICDIYTKQKKYNNAFSHLKIAEKLANETNSANEIKLNHERYYRLYKLTNKHDLALMHFEKLILLKDSAKIEVDKKDLLELQIKFETEKKEAEIKSLTQSNNILLLSATNKKYLIYGLSIILILLVGIGLLVFNQFKLRLKQETMKLEQKLLRTQMNPHFLFNSITSIQNFIYEHQPKEAGDYLSRFAWLMRLILENSANEYISLDKEIETLEYYLSLQKLRMNDNLDYSIEVDSDIQTSQISLPPMLTQPFIENAIEHGFRGIKETGIIKIHFAINKDVLQIKIIDNGIGIASAQQQKELYHSHKSMAMQITQERLKLLNRSKNKKMIFEIKEIEREEKKGTEVIFSIPI